MQIDKGIKQLVAEAEAQVRGLSPTEVVEYLSNESVLLVDIRDVRELKHEPSIANALHVPRGMLEFWIDPDSPYYKDRFDQVDQVILYCNKGWRSALAAKTLQDMGVKEVFHMQGGLERWREEIDN
ncbi:MAG: rhodanese [SAR86 cluster bacterium]|uniref:Rhodanese n=1 Tax=SAR86 cluster bacterium TaxID=2030880 RepID=A0A2A4MVJ2_9GAMM|nr:MAG: rhodanese [SAR86 cluster bacterium]